MSEVKNLVSGEEQVAATTTTQMEILVEPFNDIMKEKVREDFIHTIGSIEDFIMAYGEERGCMLGEKFECEYDYEDLWQNWICGKEKVEPSVAINYYRENRTKFINEKDMSKYLEELAKEYRVVIENDGGGCFICMKNPYSGGCIERVVDIVKVVNGQWEANVVGNHVKLDWSLFEEKDKKLMLSNKEIAERVYDWLYFIHRPLFSECHVYDDCFYMELNRDFYYIYSIRKEREKDSEDFIEFIKT
ncbi:MAG: hypothetical protein IKZ14_00660 [Muribaculaceae bacterium]|nr:hypothetical protein [Muribaculaceae bacterium]